MVELEEEAGCSRDHTATKGAHMYHTLWCQVHDHLAKLFIIRRELLVFLGEMSRVLIIIRSVLFIIRR